MSRERVLRAAIEIADRGGIEALTMRNLAHEVGVEAMSLYYHVANKDEVLDGVVDVIVDEIIAAVSKTPMSGAGWKTAVRQRILTARQILLRHPWLPGVMESRTTMSTAVLLYYESLLGLLRQGGFSVDLAHHALHALGSRALGFTQELFQSDGDENVGDEEAAMMFQQMADRLPYLAEMTAAVTHGAEETTLGTCDDQFEFEFALDLLLDGLDRLREAEQSGIARRGAG